VGPLANNNFRERCPEPCGAEPLAHADHLIIDHDCFWHDPSTCNQCRDEALLILEVESCLKMEAGGSS
jgi:hypothetical protein